MRANDKYPERGEIKLIGAGLSEGFFSRWSLGGCCEKWYKNGQLEERYTVDKNGQKNGLYERWFTNGQLERRCTYKNDKLHGSFKSWYRNGQQELWFHFNNGEIDGACQSWNQDGLLVEHMYYEQGLPIGSYPLEVKEAPKQIKVQKPKKKGGVKL